MPATDGSLTCAELTELSMRQLVRDSRALRDKAEAISRDVARVDAMADVLSARIKATRERLRVSWERMQAG